MKELDLNKEKVKRLRNIKPQTTVKQALLIVIGVIMIACAIHFFLLPNEAKRNELHTQS